MTEKEKMQNAQNKKEQKMQALSEEQYMNKIGLGSVVNDERDSLMDEIKLTGDLATKQFRERKHFFDPEVDDLQTIRETPLAPGETDYGQSKYDDNPLHINRFDDKSEELIQNRRASQQSGLTQMALGLTRGLVLTGTTAIDGTAGLVYGIGSAIKEREFDQLWNNELSKWLDSINEDARKAMPVYESTTQENNPWIQNIGRAGFWSSIVENSGFMAGSILGGKLPAGMIGKLGGKVASVAGKTAAEANKIAAASAQAGGVLSMAMNEAGVQARETYKNAMKAYAKPLNDEYDARLRPLNQKVAQMEERLSVLNSMIGREGALALPETIAEYEQLMSDYEYVRNMRDGIEKEKTEKIKSIEESAFAAGNLDYIQNLAILAPMDMIGVGKMYRRGFDKSVESSLIKGKWGDYSVDAKSKWSAIGNMGNEAAQEVAQNISGKTAVNYYSADAINRYRKMNDPEAEEEVSNYMQSLAKGFGEGIMDPQAWEEAFSVAVTMGFGHPVIRSKNEMKDADGNKRSRIGWGNSVFNEISDISRDNKNAQEIVDVMNKFSKDPGTYEMMSGLVHHRAMDKAMAEALSQKDEFDYRNAEYQQMLGDISAFSRAGRIGDLINSMQRGKDLSDEDLENMIAQSTGINEEGRLFGPYSEYARLDPEGNIISRELTDEDKKAVREKIDKNVGKQMELIDKWDKIRREHMSRFGNGSNDALIDELTYMRLYFEHFPDRAKEMGEDMKSVYDKLTESMKGTIAREEQKATESLKEKEDEIYRKEDRLKFAATKDENYLKDDDGFFIAPEDDYRKSYNRHQEAIQKLDKTFEDKKSKHEEFIKKHSDREELYKKQIEGAERDVEKAERELKTAQKAIEDKTKEKENLDKLIIKKRKDVRKAISAAKKGSTLKSDKSDILENEIEKLTTQTKALDDEIETYKSSAKDAEEEVRKAKNTQKKHLRDIEKARKEDAKERDEEAKRFDDEAKAYNDKRKEYLEAQKRIEDNIARLAENARKEQEELSALKEDYDRTMAQYEKARENNRVLETAMDMLLKGDISWFVNAENFMSNDEVQSPSDLIDMSIENIGKTAELLGMSEAEVSSLVGKLNDMAQCIANMKKIKDQYNKYVGDLSKLEKDMDNIDKKADKERKRKEADRSHKEFKEDVDDMSLKSLLDNKDKIEAELERRKNDLSDSEKAAIERAKRDSESEPDFKDKLSQYLMDDGRSKEETDSLLAKIAENEDLQETKLAIMEAEALKNAIDDAVKEIDDPLMRTFFDRAFKKLMSRAKNAKTVLAPDSDVLLDPKGVFGEDEYAKDAELIDSFADENIRESVIEKANFYFNSYFDELRKTKEAKESFDSAPKTESEGTVQEETEDEDKGKTTLESSKTDNITPGEKIDQSVSSTNYNILSTTEFALYDDKELKKKWKDLEPEWNVAEREGKSAYNQYTPERNKRLKMVWEYLDEKGVFKDRRDHRIPDGTEVFYLVDLDFCKKIQNELNESNITNDNCFVIFYAVKDGDEYRIIGDVKPEWAIINDEGSEVIPGLRSVISNIRNEVAASSQETGMFVSGYRNKTRGNGNNDTAGMGLIAVTENTFNTLEDVFTDSEGRKLIPEFELQDDGNDGKKNVAVKIRYADTENYRTRLVRLPKTLSDCGKNTEFRKDAEKLIDQWLADSNQKASDDLFKMFYYTEKEKGGSKFWNEARSIAKEKGKEAAKKFIIDGGDNGHKAYLSFDFTKLANGDTGYVNKTKDVIKVDIHKGQYKTINNFFTLYALDPNGNIMDGSTDATKDFSFSDNGDNTINVDNSGKYHVVERGGTYTLYEGGTSVLSTENETEVQSLTGEDGDRKKKLLAKAYVIRNAYAGSVAVRIPFLGGNVFYIMDQDKLVGVDEAQSVNTDTDTQKTISVSAPSVIEKTEPKTDTSEAVAESAPVERDNEALETFVLGTKMAYDPDDKLTILSFDQTDERTVSLAVTEAITAIESGASVSVDNSNTVLTDRLTATGYDKTESDGKTVFTAKNFDEIKETWGQGMQFVSENAVQDDNSGIFFSTSEDKGYTARTENNANDTDITINFSPNKNSAGYKKTKKTAGDKFFDVNDSTTAEDFEGKLKMLNLTKESPLKVNIAGNGLNETRDMDQKAFDNDVYKFLKMIKDAGFNVVYIRTGGQTGADEAGAITGRKLGIVTEVHGPADWIFRPQDGKDIKDESAYKERFSRDFDIEESQTKTESVSNVEAPVVQPTQQPVQNEAPASSKKRTPSEEEAKNSIKSHIRNNLLKTVEEDESAGDKALIDAIANAAYTDLSEDHMPYEENGQWRLDDEAKILIKNQAHDKVDKYLNDNLDNKSFQSSSNVLLDAIDGRRKRDANRPLANVIANQQLPPSQGNGGSYTFTSCQETIEMPFPLNEGQTQALDKIDKFLDGDDRVFVLKGYAGTGKTSIIRAVKQLFDKKKGGKVFDKTLDLRATTGAACVAMNNALGILEVDTVASLTAKSVSRGNSVWAPDLNGKVIVVDESSMLNSSEFQKLMTSLDYDDCKIIFVGDPAQLAPVESGTDHSKVFDINTTDETSHELTQVMRTGDNAILREATNVRTNGKDFSYESSFNEKGEGVAFISNSKAFVDSAIEIFKRCRETGEEAMICAYENKDVIEYNRRVRESLGFSGDQFQVGETTMYYGQNRKDKTDNKTIMELVNGGTYKVLKASENTNADKKEHEYLKQYFLDILDSLKNIENGYMSRFERLVKYIFDKGLVYQVQVESELDKRGFKSNAQTVSYVDANKMSQEMKGDYAKFCAEIAYLNLAYSDAMDSFALLPMITQKNTDLDKSLLGSEFKGKDNAVKLYLQRMHHTRTGGKPLSDAQFGRISMMKPLERTIDYGYASTVHKSQGKTIDHILVDMQKVETNNLLNEKDRRELAYVGVTRARKTATIFTSATKREGNPVTGEVDSKIKDTHGLSIFSASEGASGRPKFTPNESSKPNFHPDNIPNFDPGESGEPAKQQGLIIRSHINIVSQEDKGKVSHKEHLMFNRNMPSLSMEARANLVSAINDCLGKRDFVAIRKAKEAAAYLAFGNNNPLSRKQAVITMLPFMVGADEAKRLLDKYGETNLYSLMKKYLDAGIDDEIGDNDRKAFDTANAFVKALEKGRNNVNSVFDSLTQGKDVERESNPVMFMATIGNKAIEGIETNGWSAKEIEHYKNVCL